MSSAAPLPVPGYEPRDASPGGIMITCGIVVACILATLGAAGWMMEAHRRADISDWRSRPDAQFQHGPEFRTSIAQDWVEQDHRVHEHLSTYGWVDRDRHVVRVPIERAMELIAKEAAP